METDFSGEQSYTQATPPDPSYDTSPIGSDVIQAGTSNNFGLSFADDAQATADRSNVLSQASFNEAMGITALNPFGNNNFFSGNSTISGNCKINNNCFFGVNSSTRDNLEINNFCFIEDARTFGEILTYDH